MSRLVHTCGWVSDGGAFPEGAGCPRCGERIAFDDLDEVAEVTAPPRARGNAPTVVRIDGVDSDALESMVVSSAVAFISSIKDLGQLGVLYDWETDGKKRKAVLAAINAQASSVEPSQ